MYLKEFELENLGPIDYLNQKLEFHRDGNPKPLLIIGENGAGKSILISHIVNAIISARQTVYDDSDVEKGKVYKYRSPAYIKAGTTFSKSTIKFEENFYLSEWQLERSKTEFEQFHQYTSVDKEWNEIKPNDTSLFKTNFHNNENKLRELADRNCQLYFPANRFEEPAWLNYGNLTNRADYRFLNNTSSTSNRQIINYSPLKDNQNWLLDVLLDKYTLEIKTTNVNFPINQPGSSPINIPLNVLQGYSGESHNIHNAVLQFLNTLFQQNSGLRLGVGKRRSRAISILKNEKAWIPNLFNLSSGETALLNIFLTIIKDFDLTKAVFSDLNEIRGIVVIDEIDIHLHSNHQYKILPELIKLFPKVQFIITTHSPLFLLGMRNYFEEDGFDVINMPTGRNVDVEDFSEFEKGYKYFRESLRFEKDLQNEIKKTRKDFLFVEGDYDMKYLQKAASLLGKEKILEDLKIIDSVGYGSIDKVYKHFDTKLSEVTPQKMLLLYDCDTNKKDSNKSQVYKRVIPTIEQNPINKGIENLFPKSTIDKAIHEKLSFVDITPEITKLVRGKEVTVPEKWEINPNEKGNLCNWLVENGTKEDFKNFEEVFNIIAEVKKAG